MPFKPSVLHPTAAECYRLAETHGSLTHPLCVGFIAELEAGEGRGQEFLAECREIINERRLARGLPPIDFGGAER